LSELEMIFDLEAESKRSVSSFEKGKRQKSSSEVGVDLGLGQIAHPLGGPLRSLGVLDNITAQALGKKRRAKKLNW
jgi:hypothetical protein